jgi:hypothetical protein
MFCDMATLGMDDQAGKVPPGENSTSQPAAFNAMGNWNCCPNIRLGSDASIQGELIFTNQERSGKPAAVDWLAHTVTRLIPAAVGSQACNK